MKAGSVEDEVLYINGEFLRRAEAVIPVDDRGFLYGDGIFETLRAYNGVPFMLKEHVERMWESAAALSLPLPPTDDEFHETVVELLRRNRMRDAYIRITLTRGKRLGGLRPEGISKGTLLIETRLLPATRTAGEPGGRIYAVGQVRPSLTISEFSVPKCLSGKQELQQASDPRPSLPGTNAVVSVVRPESRPVWSAVVYHGRRSSTAFIHRHKTLNQMENIVALGWAEAHDADEAIFLDEKGRVLEGTRTNIFAVKNGKIVTPSLALNILPGITRSVALRLAREVGIVAVEEDFGLETLMESDEIFLTNSIEGIIAVRSMNSRKLADAESNVTRTLALAYANEVKRSCGA